MLLLRKTIHLKIEIEKITILIYGFIQDTVFLVFYPRINFFTTLFFVERPVEATPI